MRILPVDTNRQSTNFTGAKIRNVRLKSRLRHDVNREQSNYLQAIMFGLAFIAATFTKYFIDHCNNKHKQPSVVEASTTQEDAEINDDTLVIK